MLFRVIVGRGPAVGLGGSAAKIGSGIGVVVPVEVVRDETGRR